MQKWSPEPFETPEASTLPAGVATAEFETGEAGLFGSPGHATDVRQFRSELGFTDSKSLMNSLTTDERGQVYELVEMDLVEEYQEREKQLREEFGEQVAADQAEMASQMAQWTTDLSEIMARQIKEMAAAAANLAVQVAGKLVRAQVAADPSVLARLIETTTYKITESEPLTIQASVPDAEWLSGQTELCERLHIGEIVADRRVEAGGCLIRCGKNEWDATLARQLGSLEEIVSEMVATGNSNPTGSESGLMTPIGADAQTDTLPEPEADNVTGLD